LRRARPSRIVLV